MTLRGTIFDVVRDTFTQERILAYESRDRTRAWKITGCFVWPAEKVAPLFSKDGAIDSNTISCDATLWTDSVDDPINGSLDLAENRSIGWCNQGWKVNVDPTTGKTRWWAPSSFKDMTELVIDVDRIATNELYIGIDWGSAILDDAPTLDWSFMIVLEEISITAQASLLQQLKGIGQSIQ